MAFAHNDCRPTHAMPVNLCLACGLCCNGVMFHTVRLQPADSAPALAALGLRLKRKKGAHYILQPCPAWREAQCSIYAARPERCRVFACRQLERVAAGETTEAAALEKIREVQGRVAQVEALLARAGRTDAKRPLAKRCEKILAEPPELSANPAALALHEELRGAMAALNAVLDADFRLTPLAVSEGDAPALPESFFPAC